MAAMKNRKLKTKSKHVEHNSASHKDTDLSKLQNTILNSGFTAWKILFFIVIVIPTSYYVLSFDENVAIIDDAVVSASSKSSVDTTKQEQVSNLESNTAIKENAKKVKKGTAKKNKSNAQEFEATICPEIVMPNMVNYAGRNLKIEELKHDNRKSSVRLYLIDDFLTKEECDGLSVAHLRHVKKGGELGPLICFSGLQTFRKYLKEAALNIEVTDKDFTPGTNCINATFSETLKEKLAWSHSTAFYRTESKFSKLYEERIENITGLLKSHGGKFQITSYKENVGYKSHTDCNIGSTELRDRYATTLVYLENVREGGETIFSDLGLSVQPKQGRLIVWNNMKRDGECDPTSIHRAAPVIRGRKYILQRWYYYKNFPALGNRNPEPDIPQRKEMQPRVACDKFEEGSCRWYDEWGYDHLTEYNKVEKLLV